MEHGAVSEVSIIPLFSVKEENPITVRVQRQNTADILYKMGRNTPLRRLMIDYCERIGLVFGAVRFTYDGSRAREYQTPEELKMEDDDIIDAWNDQVGGCLLAMN